MRPTALHDECFFAYWTSEVLRVTAVSSNDHRRYCTARAPECNLLAGFELFCLLHGLDWGVYLTRPRARVCVRQHDDEKKRSEKAARDFSDDLVFHCMFSFVDCCSMASLTLFV